MDSIFHWKLCFFFWHEQFLLDLGPDSEAWIQRQIQWIWIFNMGYDNKKETDPY